MKKILGVVSLLLITFLSIYLRFNSLKSKEKVSSVVDEEIKEVIPVFEDIKTFIKPYNIEVEKSLLFYDYNSSSDEQEKAIIEYQSTFLPSTGVFYSSSNIYDVLAVYDGEVVDITSDQNLNNVIKIEHGNNIISTYSCISNIQVNKGDVITTGMVIATSSKCNILSKYNNGLYFEVYKDGEVINPEIIFNKAIIDL